MADSLQPPNESILEGYRRHYAASFARHGASSKGVDWGEWPDLHLRYAKMLDVIERQDSRQTPVTLLDVGCGFGGLLDYAKDHATALNYIGIDLVPEMIEFARARHSDARFMVGDILSVDEPQGVDYAVCNGILTLKLETSIMEMDRFARSVIRKMYSIARRGIAFNIMSSHVNFTSPKLFYKSPVETLAFCSQLSRRFRLDHAYPLYEYTTYIYRDQPGANAAGQDL